MTDFLQTVLAVLVGLVLWEVIRELLSRAGEAALAATLRREAEAKRSRLPHTSDHDGVRAWAPEREPRCHGPTKIPGRMIGDKP